MTTLQTALLSEPVKGERIPIGKRAYFRAQLSNRLHELVLDEFARLEQEKKMTRRELALRIDKDPSQITNYLSAPGNWTIDTISDLFLGLGIEPIVSRESMNSVQPINVWALASTLDPTEAAPPMEVKEVKEVKIKSALEVAQGKEDTQKIGLGSMPVLKQRAIDQSNIDQSHNASKIPELA